MVYRTNQYFIHENVFMSRYSHLLGVILESMCLRLNWPPPPFCFPAKNLCKAPVALSQKAHGGKNGVPPAHGFAP